MWMSTGGTTEMCGRWEERYGRVNFQVNNVIVKCLQWYSSSLSQGFEDEDLRNSPGWLASTVATYCPSRPSQLLANNITKPCDRLDE